MTHGFSNTEVVMIKTPDIPEDMPFLIDDCTLAFFLGFNTRILWYAITRKDELYTRLTIPKKSGGSRVIHAPDKVMKLFGKRILERLLNPLQKQLGDHVTAYREGRSTQMAVEQHVPECPICDTAPPGTEHDCPHRGTYFNLDLKNFFPSTRRVWIRQYFKQVIGYSHYVSDLLASLVTVYAFTDSSGYQFSGVPQGNPASGAICNLVADWMLDTPMLALIDDLNKEQGLEGEYAWKYTRYADDLAFTCGKRFSYYKRMAILNKLMNVCTRSGYAVNHTKTRIWDGRHRKALLGAVFNTHTNIPRDQYISVRSLTYNCWKHGFESQCSRAGKDSEEELRWWLLGRINYMEQIHSGKGQQLKSVYNAAVQKYDKNKTHPTA
ncbi:MAG: hypothetical protein DRP01_00365 [Archaeoglobales archaeon]|nr:MAG: hypothetical protein DRP01_00365 [Archaeoglobales archaeon]